MTKPSDFHPDLQEESIAKLAQLIAQAFADSLDYRLPERGDTRWSHGCRRYDWARYNIRVAVGAPGFDFLTMLEDQGRKFTFKIGKVPVKFKRTDANNPDKSIFRQYELEAKQLSLLKFAGIQDPCELSWRILVEDDIEGDVVRVVFVGADENGNTKCFWEVPHEKFAPKVVGLSTAEESVELKPASVKLKTTKKDQKKA